MTSTRLTPPDGPTWTPAGRRRLSRAAHVGGYLVLTGLTAVVDVLPARIRFGHARTLIQRTLGLASVPRLPAPSLSADAEAGAGPAVVEGPGPICALVTETLDVGGVEAVVGLLAVELPGFGFRCSVVTMRGGRHAETLRQSGVRVEVVDQPAGLSAVLNAISPDVIQVHTATPPMIDVLIASGIPLVPVVHNVELYRGALGWAATAELSRTAAVTIAVSEAVRRDHLQHVGDRAGGESVTVIPNGAPRSVIESAPPREVARARVAAALGVDVRDDVLVVSLARYDIQKNATGLVDAFLRAATHDSRLRLIAAGDPADWLEYRRADALRRSHPLGDRVHLLGNSDSATLLSAADVFALNSYFEGWPVAATEARTLGLPVVMAAVGGAAELVGTGGAAGVVVENASGPNLTRRSVARARRRLHQRTQVAFADALVEVAQRDEGHASKAAPDGRGRMIAAHAGILAQAARVRADR